MKKTLAITLALLMAFSFAACGKTEDAADDTSYASVTEVSQENTEEIAGVANPMVEMESLEAINEQLGCNLIHPGVMGVTDESFYIINETLGQYKFSVNGVEYCFRFKDAEEDFSGVYVGETTLLAKAGDGEVVATQGYIGSRWFAEEGQYCLVASGDVDAETFANIVEELQSIQAMDEDTAAEDTVETADADPASWYANLEGDWADTVSQRASMTVANCEDHAFITVLWGDSASVTYEWTMNVTMEEAAEDGTNKLVYTDCVQRKLESDGTTETVTALYENGEGYFTLNEGGFLLWDGAADENCTSCIFEQIVE